MSTTYGLRCVTCGVDTETDWHEPYREVLLCLGAGMRAGMDVSALDFFGGASMDDFGHVHRGHEIALLNEYGDVAELPRLHDPRDWS